MPSGLAGSGMGSQSCDLFSLFFTSNIFVRHIATACLLLNNRAQSNRLFLLLLCNTQNTLVKYSSSIITWSTTTLENFVIYRKWKLRNKLQHVIMLCPLNLQRKYWNTDLLFCFSYVLAKSHLSEQAETK